MRRSARETGRGRGAKATPRRCPRPRAHMLHGVHARMRSACVSASAGRGADANLFWKASPSTPRMAIVVATPAHAALRASTTEVFSFPGMLYARKGTPCCLSASMICQGPHMHMHMTEGVHMRMTEGVHMRMTEGVHMQMTEGVGQGRHAPACTCTGHGPTETRAVKTRAVKTRAGRNTVRGDTCACACGVGPRGRRMMDASMHV